jgi:hypothetical protein
MDTQAELHEKYVLLFAHLDERQRRLLAAADAERLGYGGIALVARASGLSRPTLSRALRDLHADPLAPHRTRRPGAGRKPLTQHDPALVQALEALLDPATRGDPQSPLCWTCKSTRQLAHALTAAGHPVSHTAVAGLLGDLDYCLQANAKTREGTQHPDRNAQFEYIYETTKQYLAQGWPVISVDTKKKELVGNYANSGAEWQPMSCPDEVDTHDFPDPKVPKAVPYGVYDVGRDAGWVNVGCSHDTAQFAVESIRRWWRGMGAGLYPRAGRLLICADAGGSNGYRLHLWKYELQRWADEVGLDVTVCHCPPGTSKWNKIEHRLFCHITMNWRGRPLVSYRVIVNLIAATKTDMGLRVQAELDTRPYPTKVKVTKKQMATVHLQPHEFHGEWNYTLKHQSPNR